MSVTYTYSGLSAGTYFVRVRAVYAGGLSSWRASDFKPSAAIAEIQ